MDKKMKKAIVAGLVVLPIVPFLWWCGGYDFNHRGDVAVMCAVATMCVFGLTVVASRGIQE